MANNPVLSGLSCCRYRHGGHPSVRGPWLRSHRLWRNEGQWGGWKGLNEGYTVEKRLDLVVGCLGTLVG